MARAELLAGFASEIITPDPGCPLAGFDARKGVATGVHDDLYSRALVLDDGRTKVAIVSIDVLGVSRAFANQVRVEIEHRTGISSRNVVLSATHTHCAPVTLNHFFNQGQPLDGRYVERLASAIASSVEQAHGSRKPRRLRTGFVSVDGIAVNRRTDSGLPIDETAGVILLEELDGRPAAVALFYACHTTTLGPDTLEITADFPYYTIRNVKQKLGGAVEVMYLNGAEGDLSVGHKSDLSAVGIIAPNRTFKRAEELGSRLADCVLAGLDRLTPEEAVLAVEESTVRLPMKSYAPLSDMQARRTLAGKVMRWLESSGAPERDVILAKQRSLFSRIDEYYASLSEGLPDPKLLDAELVAIRMGNTAVLSFLERSFVV